MPLRTPMRGMLRTDLRSDVRSSRLCRLLLCWLLQVLRFNSARLPLSRSMRRLLLHWLLQVLRFNSTRLQLSRSVRRLLLRRPMRRLLRLLLLRLRCGTLAQWYGYAMPTRC